MVPQPSRPSFGGIGHCSFASGARTGWFGTDPVDKTAKITSYVNLSYNLGLGVQGNYTGDTKKQLRWMFRSTSGQSEQNRDCGEGQPGR